MYYLHQRDYIFASVCLSFLMKFSGNIYSELKKKLKELITIYLFSIPGTFVLVTSLELVCIYRYMMLLKVPYCTTLSQLRWSWDLKPDLREGR